MVNSIKRNEFLIISGNGVSHFGDVIFTFALNWWIVSITGDAKLLGIITSLSLLPAIITNLFGGVISDKFNKKLILILTDLFSAVACLVLALYSSDNYINIPLVITINILLSISFSLFSPAARSIVPEVVEKERVKNINSIISSVNETIKVASPLIGGLLLSISFIDIKVFFIINALTFLISGLSEILLKYEWLEPEDGNDGVIKDFIDGFKYIKEDITLFRLLIVIALVNFFCAGYNILLPAFVNDYFDKTYIYSLVLSSEAIGGILGAILLNKSKDSSIPKLVDIKKELFFSGVVFILLFISNSLIPLVLVTFLFGYFLTRFNILFFSYVQTNTESKVLGRVFSFIFSTAIMLMPLGSLIFGYLSLLPLSTILPLCGIGICLSFMLVKTGNNKRLA